MWLECPADEWDCCSRLVGGGLDALLPLVRSEGPTAAVSALLRLAAGARWLGGRAWCERLASAVEAEPAVVIGLDCTRFTALALRLAQGLLEDGVNPFTEAHQPHSRIFRAVAKRLADGEQRRCVHGSAGYLVYRSGVMVR